MRHGRAERLVPPLHAETRRGICWLRPPKAEEGIVIPAELLALVAESPDDAAHRVVLHIWLTDDGEGVVTEEDFQKYLDAYPTHHDMRMRFGEWLSGDARGEGYRALGQWKRQPDRQDRYPKPIWHYTWTRWPAWLKDDYQRFPMCMPWEWWDLYRQDTDHLMGHFFSRQESEDKMALAFTRLPLTRRAELLSGKVAVTT